MKVGLPWRWVRRTQVLTKKPTRSVRLSSVRLAMGEPMVMSSPAPRPCRRTARAASRTIEEVAPWVRASSPMAVASCGSRVNSSESPRWLASVGRGRSVGR
ncbi:hypothetical protein SMD44_08076 [Streptomyces alboflavus]|uniref:Uncharacterized protein n=1 Tax=Streptomyces alboflavus TaxID=67267 RepID=A0A1Z1WQC6_9ACTN|nr:hypothetical protein SMD44_08076 [Streptomyces alboflavus]